MFSMCAILNIGWNSRSQTSRKNIMYAKRLGITAFLYGAGFLVALCGILTVAISIEAIFYSITSGQLLYVLVGLLFLGLTVFCIWLSKTALWAALCRT
jgi:hypothetical protein